MKHLILVIAMLAAAAAAHAQQPNCLVLKKVKIADHVLHQQGETLATLTLKVKNCEIIADHQQTTVTFESLRGLDVALDDIAFRRPEDEDQGASLNQVREVTVILKLTASPDFPVGETTLHGMLTYQAVSGGSVVPKTVGLSIPVKVEWPQPPKQHTEPNAFVQGLEIAGEIMLGIIALPIMLIYCPLSGECPTC